MITSPRNPRLRLVNRLRSRSQRERLGFFVCVGEDIVEAALQKGLVPSELFVAGAADAAPVGSAAGAASVEGLNAARVPALELFPGALEVESSLLAKITGMAHAPQVVGVFRRADLPRASAVDPSPRNLALWRVSDPGNVGAIVRSADALGPCGVYLSRGCGDPTGPKAVRAAAGALVRVPLGDFDAAPRPWFALVPGAAEAVGAELGSGTLVCGAERAGLPPDVIDRCDRVVSIPTAAGAESLNVAVAAAIALHAMRG